MKTKRRVLLLLSFAAFTILFWSGFSQNAVGLSLQQPLLPNTCGPTSHLLEMATAFVQREAKSGNIPQWKDVQVVPGVAYYNLDDEVIAYEVWVQGAQRKEAGYLLFYLPECQVVEFSDAPSPFQSNLDMAQKAAQKLGMTLEESHPIFISLFNKFFLLHSKKHENAYLMISMIDQQVIALKKQNSKFLQTDIADIANDFPGPVTPSCPASPQASKDTQDTQGNVTLTQKVLSVPVYHQFCYKGCWVGCTPTAGGTLLGYWSSRGFSNLLADGYQAAIKSLNDRAGTWCEGSGSCTERAGVTVYRNLTPALEGYCTDKGYPGFDSQYYNYQTATFSILKNEIDQNFPLVVSFSATSPPYDWLHGHSNTGVGYDTANGHYMILQTNLQSYPGQKRVLFESNSHGPINFNTLHPGDMTPPETQISFSGTLGENNWYQSDVQVSLSSQDNPGGQGVKQIQYRLDGEADWHSVTGNSISFSIQTEGNHVIEYRAQDKVGNWESTKSKSLQIDKTPPTGAVSLNQGSTIAFSTIVAVDLQANDNVSGVWQMRIRRPDEAWGEWENFSPKRTWTLSPNPVDGNEYSVEVQIRDRAGNIASLPLQQILLHLYPQQPSSAHYFVQRASFFTSAQSGEIQQYHLQGGLGQPLVGTVSSTHYQLHAGYWFNAPTVVNVFSDVPDDYWAVDYINRLYRAGITGGCGTNPLRYCPEANVTRAQMAVFLERGIHGSDYTPPDVEHSSFGDVADNFWAKDWIEALYNDGVTSGCGNGNFCPDGNVTRAQMAVFLLRAEHGSDYQPPQVEHSRFNDVPDDFWAKDWIDQLAEEGITSGCGGGNYCPDGSVTRAQMAVFLVRAFNLP